MELLKALNWRYATKRMTGEKLDQTLVDQILEAARLAPTSAGIQPFKIIAISNAELKKALSAVALNQPQIIESSHVLVFAAWDTLSPERINAMYDYMAKERSQDPSVTAEVVAGLNNLFSTFTLEQQYHHAAKQAYIGLGLALGAAAMLKVDSTPMEGFDKEGVDKLLELEKLGLKSVALMALGRRAPENDWLLKLKKVRLPIHEFVIEKK